MAERRLEACLIAAPENVFYLTGLEHQGYFAYQALIVPLDGQPILVTRAMERATVRDQVAWVQHVGYSDGVEPVPKARDKDEDLVLSTQGEGGARVGLRPWDSSLGLPVAGPVAGDLGIPVATTARALVEADVANGTIGIEEASTFLPYGIVRRLIDELSSARWVDCSGLVDDCRLVQSPLEIECTRKAAKISESMLLAAIAAAGPGVHEREIMAAIYDAMFRRGGTYPGFVPLVRSTQTLEHEHGTWRDGRLRSRGLLFLEMAGCVRRYHAPIGRLVHIGKATARSARIQTACERALLAAAETVAPGVEAGQVYEEWQRVIDDSGLSGYRRHHCGYSVGIGFPPSWSGSGTPRGLRRGSRLVLEAGMVFHLMSWLLRTGRGDSFLSDTILVTDGGCELLTDVTRALTVR